MILRHLNRLSSSEIQVKLFLQKNYIKTFKNPVLKTKLRLGCTFVAVASILSSLPTTIYTCLYSLALLLQLPLEKVEHIKHDIDSMMPSLGIIVKILIEYRALLANNATLDTLMNTLRDLGRNDAAAALMEKFAIRIPNPTYQTQPSTIQVERPIWYHVTEPSHFFTGRTEYLERI